MNKYPRLGEIWPRRKNITARCRCGEIAKYQVSIEYNMFRGDDGVIWSCDTHKRDKRYLLEQEVE